MTHTEQQLRDMRIGVTLKSGVGPHFQGGDVFEQGDSLIVNGLEAQGCGDKFTPDDKDRALFDSVRGAPAPTALKTLTADSKKVESGDSKSGKK